MGFTTGFLGGATLTYSLLYLSLYLHKSNRNVQHTILLQSNSLLNSVISPPEPIPDPPPYELRRGGLAEQLKDRWNSEIEKMVRRVQTTDWTREREELERRVGEVWRGVKHSEQAQEVERKVKEGVESAKAAARDVGDRAQESAREMREKVEERAKEVGERAQEGVRRANERVEEAAEGLKRDGGEVVKEKVRGKRLLELD